MNDAGLARLANALHDAIEQAPNRDPGPARAAVAEAFRVQPRIILGAWDALRARGQEPGPREVHAVAWARGLVDAALAVLHLPANEESRRAVAQGLADLFATALERHDQGAR